MPQQVVHIFSVLSSQLLVFNIPTHCGTPIPFPTQHDVLPYYINRDMYTP